MSKEITAALRAPFRSTEVKWRVGAKTKGDTPRGQALPYVDARCVQDRLDDAVGVENWKISYRASPTGVGLVAELSLRVSGEWITKEDGAFLGPIPEEFKREDGSPDLKAEQNAEMSVKAAYSDAFKRAAVVWGIGRYLYDVPAVWTELDNYGAIKTRPQMPDWALPESERGSQPPRGAAQAASASQPAQAAPAASAQQSASESSAKSAQQGDAASRVYLNVPREQKDAAKALGARWDGDQKKWFAPNADVAQKCVAWVDGASAPAAAAPAAAQASQPAQAAAATPAVQQAAPAKDTPAQQGSSGLDLNAAEPPSELEGVAFDGDQKATLGAFWRQKAKRPPEFWASWVDSQVTNGMLSAEQGAAILKVAGQVAGQ